MTIFGGMSTEALWFSAAMLLAGIPVLGIFLQIRAEGRRMRRPCGRRIITVDGEGKRIEFILSTPSSDPRWGS